MSSSTDDNPRAVSAAARDSRRRQSVSEAHLMYAQYHRHHQSKSATAEAASRVREKAPYFPMFHKVPKTGVSVYLVLGRWRCITYERTSLTRPAHHTTTRPHDHTTTRPHDHTVHPRSRTQVIYATSRASLYGFQNEDPEWANMGQVSKMYFVTVKRSQLPANHRHHHLRLLKCLT
jgi:hypothetical protein